MAAKSTESSTKITKKRSGDTAAASQKQRHIVNTYTLVFHCLSIL